MECEPQQKDLSASVVKPENNQNIMCSPVTDNKLCVRHGDPVVMTTDDPNHTRI